MTCSWRSFESTRSRRKLAREKLKLDNKNLKRATVSKMQESDQYLTDEYMIYESGRDGLDQNLVKKGRTTLWKNKMVNT